MNKSRISFILIGVSILCLSCTVQSNLKTNQSTIYKSNIVRYTQGRILQFAYPDSLATYQIILPSNYDKNIMRYSNGQYDTQEFVLFYSYGISTIYFSFNYYYGGNDKNLNAKLSDTSSRFYKMEYYYQNNTIPPNIITEGVDSNNLYWKDIRNDWVCYGYYNVLLEEKPIFDSILNSIQRIY